MTAASSQGRTEELFRRLGNDRIAVTAQSSHSGGSPMSQRECAGFNCPPLVIPASEPINISPVTVSRAGPFDSANNFLSLKHPGVTGVSAHSVSHTVSGRSCCSLLAYSRPADKLLSLTLGQFGVFQPANAASAESAPPAWFGPPLLPSVARGVFHVASCAGVCRFSP